IPPLRGLGGRVVGYDERGRSGAVSRAAGGRLVRVGQYPNPKSSVNVATHFPARPRPARRSDARLSATWTGPKTTVRGPARQRRAYRPATSGTGRPFRTGVPPTVTQRSLRHRS